MLQRLRRDARAAFGAAVEAVRPGRLIEEAIRYRVLRHVNIQAKELPKIIRGAVKKVYIPPSKLPKHISQVGYPPCIQKLLDDINKHENLGHQARWILAVYLTNIGLSVEQITKIYSGLPDFKESITKYQLMHIRKREYKMPSCSTIRTYGLCTSNCRVSNPLKWQGAKRQRGA